MSYLGDTSRYQFDKSHSRVSPFPVRERYMNKSKCGALYERFWMEREWKEFEEKNTKLDNIGWLKKHC